MRAITDFNIDPHRDFLYRVVWVGDWDDSWKPPAMLSCPDLVDDFHQSKPKKASLTMGNQLERNENVKSAVKECMVQEKEVVQILCNRYVKRFMNPVARANGNSGSSEVTW